MHRTIEVRLGGNVPAARFTMHPVRYDGAWKWYFNANAYWSFVDGECPSF